MTSLPIRGLMFLSKLPVIRMSQKRMSNVGKLGGGAGKGGGAGGSVREAGGALGEAGAAREEVYFRKKSAELLKKLKGGKFTTLKSFDEEIKAKVTKIEKAEQNPENIAS